MQLEDSSDRFRCSINSNQVFIPWYRRVTWCGMCRSYYETLRWSIDRFAFTKVIQPALSLARTQATHYQATFLFPVLDISHTFMLMFTGTSAYMTFRTDNARVLTGYSIAYATCSSDTSCGTLPPATQSSSSPPSLMLLYLLVLVPTIPFVILLIWLLRRARVCHDL